MRLERHVDLLSKVYILKKAPQRGLFAVFRARNLTFMYLYDII